MYQIKGINIKYNKDLYLYNYNNYFKSMQRAHRGKQLDWTKPFKLVDSKTTFDELDTDNN